eukprot:TRINITY_DN4266_c0_g1_i1.p1 TRINITY_DN4266_c0_g1~~TRINITY_DN4266_c0_g1_i1.p1  ORF type:complete len:362 (+),score=44.92 TRINITY_DN4266_c0_g1_i1:213-1298(+)
MVLIPLKSQFVSLIISFLSLFAELALLHATLRFHRYFECKFLRRGGKLSVGRHQRRVAAFSVLALLAFLALETTTSFFSDPARRSVLVDQPCLAVDGIHRRSGRNGLQIEEEAVTMRCNNLSDGNFLYSAGNFSFEEQRVICSKNVLVEFIATVTTEFILDKAQRPSTGQPNPNPLLSCIDGSCVVVETASTTSVESQSGTLLRISAMFKESELQQMRESQFPSRIVEALIFYDVSGLQPLFAERALHPMARKVRDPVEWVRRIYLGSENTTCPFDQDLGDATSIPLPLVYIVVAVWLSSAVMCISSLIVRPTIFYDISNPIDWAKHTKQNSDLQIKGDPVISTVDDGGMFVVHVSETLKK